MIPRHPKASGLPSLVGDARDRVERATSWHAPHAAHPSPPWPPSPSAPPRITRDAAALMHHTDAAFTAFHSASPRPSDARSGRSPTPPPARARAMPTALAPSPSPSPSSAADDERRMQEDDGGADADALDFSEAWNPARAFSPDAVPSPSAPTASPWTASFLSDAAAIPTAMAMPPCRTVEAIETAYNDRVAPTCFPPRATWLWTRQEHLAPAAETLEAESRHTRHTSAASAVDALYSISLPVPSPSSPSRSSPQMDAEAARPAATYHAWIDAQRKQSQRRLAQILGHLGHSC